MKTRLDILRPNLLTKVTGKQTKQKMYHDIHSGVRQFTVGQKVLVENISPKSTEARWLPATVLEKMGAVSYKVSVHNRGVWKRHADQIVVHHSSPTGSHESSASEDVDMFTEGATSEGLPNNEASVTIDSDMETTQPSAQILPATPSEVSETIPIPSGSVTEQVSSPRYPVRNRTAPDRYNPTVS